MSEIAKPTVSLLETILADPQWLARATESQATSLTVTLEIDAAGNRRIDHPHWRTLPIDGRPQHDGFAAGQNGGPQPRPGEATADTRPDHDGATLADHSPLNLTLDATANPSSAAGIHVDPAKPSPCADEGFVPARSIVPPGKRTGPDTEYRLVGQLGSGGTGIVFQAHQRAIDREVAVKVLRDELACDPVARQRFLIEARTIGSLDHPNVIALHELATGQAGIAASTR